MNKTEEIFIDAYRRALDRGGRTDRGTVDGNGPYKGITAAEWRRVLALADSHQVYPMVFESIYPGLDAAVRKTRLFEKGYKKAVELTCGQARMTAEFLKLYQFLAERGLEPIVMKGIICRSLYPEPEQRASSDEDLLVPEDAFAEYHEALIDYGLRVALPGCDVEHDHEVPYCSSCLYIEVHKQPFEPGSKACGELNRFFGNAEERKIRISAYGVPLAAMCHTDHMSFMLCHSYKHFLYCGIGIRPVSDIVLYSMAHIGQIDWGTVAERCREIHAYDFAAALYKIGQKYIFPERFPEELAGVWGTERIREDALLRDILKGGVYGASSEDRMHSANLTLGAVEDIKSGKKMSALLRILFPPGGNLRRRYPWLMKAPFLLPAAWLHRICTYSVDNVLRGREGRRAAEAIRIGNERVRLLRRYHVLEEGKKDVNPLRRLLKKFRYRRF